MQTCDNKIKQKSPSHQRRSTFDEQNDEFKERKKATARGSGLSAAPERNLISLRQTKAVSLL